MRTSLGAASLVLGALIPVAVHAQETPQQQLQAKTRAIARDAAPAVVSVSGARGKRGSGFVIDEDGRILTTASIVDGARGSIRITFRGAVHARAQIVATDPRTRAALLKLDDAASVAKRLGGKLPTLALGSAEGLAPGRIVATLGNPFESIDTDGAPALSLGIVSSIGPLRDADDFRGVAIETDAAVNPGSFGGPLVDRDGRVVGLVIEPFSPARWLGVAVPIDPIKTALDDLRAGKKPAPGQLGIKVDDGDETGVPVKDVLADSPAARIGIKAGDRLLSIFDARIAKVEDVARELALPAGTRVKLVIARDGKKLGLDAVLARGRETVVVETGPADRPPQDEATPTTDRPHGWAGLSIDSRRGALVISRLAANGPAARAGLKIGDQLVSLRWEVRKAGAVDTGSLTPSTIDDVESRLASLYPGARLSLTIDRGGEQHDYELVLADPPGVPLATPTVGDGWIGVKLKDDGARLAVVTEVAKDSPAARAGVKPGDRLAQLEWRDDKKGRLRLRNLTAEETDSTLRHLTPGTKLSAVIEREGWEKPLELEVAAAPAAPSAGEPFFGVVTSKREGSGGGLRVERVLEGSPADQAGLKQGDVLIEAEGIALKERDDLLQAMRGKHPGDKLRLRVEREDWARRMEVTLGARPTTGAPRAPVAPRPDGPPGKPGGGEPPAEAKPAWLGVAVADQDGKVLVQDIAEGSPARGAGLKSGDKITGWFDADQRRELKDVAALSQLLASRHAGDTITLEVEREGWAKKVKVKLGEKPGE